jgi:hypothetical protein
VLNAIFTDAHEGYAECDGVKILWNEDLPVTIEVIWTNLTTDQRHHMLLNAMLQKMKLPSLGWECGSLEYYQKDKVVWVRHSRA